MPLAGPKSSVQLFVLRQWTELPILLSDILYAHYAKMSFFSVNSQALMALYEANMYVCDWTMNQANNLFSCSFSATLQKS